MKNNWEIKRLGEVCEYVPVTTKVLKKDFLSSGKFPIVSQESELISGFWNNDSDVFRVGKPVVVFGDHTRVLKYVDFDFVRGADGVKIILPISNLDTRYLYYYLSLFEVRHLGYARHFRLLKELEINYPNITEQKRIVKILDEKFEAIEELKKVTEQQIVDAKELFESRLSELFNNQNWETRSFSDSSVFTIEDGDRGKNYPSKNDFDKQGHCLFMSTKNVRPNGFDFSDPVFITKAKDEELRKGKLQRGDVVMTTRGTIGNIGVYSDEVVFDHIRINSGMVIFRPNLQVIKPEFLFELLRAPIILDQIKKLTSGAAQPQLPIKTIKQFIFKLAPLGEQDNIIQELDELSEKTKGLEAIFRRKIADLEELKKSYLEQAFAGKL